MSDILRTAVGGLNDASARIARATNFIVNASSTSENVPSTAHISSVATANTDNTPHDLTSAVVSIKSDSVAYGADAAVVKVKKNLDNTLLNILA